MSDLLLPATSRRGFFKRAGLGAVAASAALQACDSTDEVTPPDLSNNVTLDLSTDTGVLNYAYALEQLDSAFYAQVLATPYDGITDAERAVFEDLASNEAVHRDFLRGALGDARIPDLTPDFSLVDFDSRLSVLRTAAVFEDLGVGAYNGAGQLLESAELLTIAGKIVSVEARHASAIRDLIIGATRTGATVGEADAVNELEGVIIEGSLDRARTPESVILSANPYVVQNIRVVGA